jgi:hypothetical protein
MARLDEGQRDDMDDRRTSEARAMIRKMLIIPGKLKKYSNKFKIYKYHNRQLVPSKIKKNRIEEKRTIICDQIKACKEKSYKEGHR